MSDKSTQNPLSESAFNELVKREGGLEAIYRRANQKYQYAGFISENANHVPTTTERMVWMRSVLELIVSLHDRQYQSGDFVSALQTRRLWQSILDELKPLSDQYKMEPK